MFKVSFEITLKNVDAHLKQQAITKNSLKDRYLVYTNYLNTSQVSDC